MLQLLSVKRCEATDGDILIYCQSSCVGRNLFLRLMKGQGAGREGKGGGGGGGYGGEGVSGLYKPHFLGPISLLLFSLFLCFFLCFFASFFLSSSSSSLSLSLPLSLFRSISLSSLSLCVS